MKQDEINTLLNSFFISQEELESRIVLKEFAHSLSSLIIDEFAQNYLLNNPYLSVYLAHTDGSMLLQKIKNFVASLFLEPVNEAYVRGIHAIGFIHYSIKLEPEKVSYGFWAINEVLFKFSHTNPLVKEHRSLISKLLKFVEHIMNDGYAIKKEEALQDSRINLEATSAQNELYIGFNIHKLNAKKIKLALEHKKDLYFLDQIKENPHECSFGKILTKIASNPQHEYILGTSADTINEMHAQWHLEFKIIKEALIGGEKEKALLHNKNISKITDKLLSTLNEGLDESLQDAHLSLRSSIKSMKNMTQLFYKKNAQELETSSEKEMIQKALEGTILSEFTWAIEKIDLSNEDTQSTNTRTLTKAIRYQSVTTYICITLKELDTIEYIHEVLHLLLEVLELQFYVQERELSLITFADEAQNANKSKDMFLANMSHELRTPINAITGFSQILMMRKDTPDKVKTYVEKINIAGNNLLDLVNTILDFAKLESGKMQFNPSLSNISQVLNETKVLIAPLADKKNITLIMPNIVSLNLYIDKTLFKQVLINLLTNAIKFTHQNGEVTLAIAYDEQKHMYVFEVRDNGLGLSPENVKKLFQAFSQVDNAYQKEHKGSGLGLMISKNIIEDLHKGKIWVQSEEDKGSSFFIAMPTPMIESSTYTINKAHSDAKHILIVEDSPEYQNILIENLQNTHKLTITDTVNKAKELLSNESYDFLILDFFLTDGVSSEILQFMEEENISIPTVVISAEDEIHISSSLSGSSNLECIINKKDVLTICASIRRGNFKQDTLQC